jgi:hypothetical protein
LELNEGDGLHLKFTVNGPSIFNQRWRNVGNLMQENPEKAADLNFASCHKGLGA